MNLGKWQVRWNRIRNQVGGLTFLMVLSMYIKENGVHWWYALVVIIVAIYAFIDDRKIFAEEQDHNIGKSRIFMRMVDSIEYIRRKVDNENKTSVDEDIEGCR